MMRLALKTLRRLKNSLREQGIKSTLFKLYILAVEYWFDFRYRTQTNTFVKLAELSVHSDNKKRGNPYQPSRIIPLRKLFRQIRPMIPPDAVLADLGCGKGRVLMIASEFGFRRARGIEFAHELCMIARKNCAGYKRAIGTRTEPEVIESDVVDYEIKSDENVFFLFNPFDEVVLIKVLDKISRSLRKAPRKVLIIYSNPLLDKVAKHQEGFARVLDADFWGYRYVVYSNGD